MNLSIRLLMAMMGVLVIGNANGFFIQQQEMIKNRIIQKFGNISKLLTNQRETPPPQIQFDHVDQHIDNFNPQNHATFEQRYVSNKIYHQPGGPIFIYLSSEPALTTYMVQGSMLSDLAQELHGCVYALEPRYYGESFPTPNVTDENLRFLTTEQHLADIAYFIEHVRNHDLHDHHHQDDDHEGHEPGHNHDDSPVIIVGIGYAGALAAWFRQLYPHLADIAWASSATVHSIINHSDFKVIAGAAYRHVGGDECYEVLQDGFAEMEQMVQDGRLEELGEIFNVCEPIESDDDVSAFFAIIAEVYAYFPLLTEYVSINYVCDTLKQSTSEPSLAHRVAIMVNILGGCVTANHNGLIELDRETDLDSIGVQFGIRQATYQFCTQLGWFHTSDSEFQPFGSRFPEEYYWQTCRDVFGDLPNNLEVNSARINRLYGGLEPDVTRVIYSQGWLDPWRTTGIQEDVNDLSPAFVIQGASNGADLWSIDEANDTPFLLDAKRRISSLLRTWISELTETEEVHPH